VADVDLLIRGGEPVDVAVEGQDQLKELGRLTLWQGAQPISFSEISG
jgi:hypothetical protein